MVVPNSHRSLFTGARNRDLYQQPYAQAGGNPALHSSGEINLRAELDELFFGYKSGVKHGYYVLIRRLRRDARGIGIPCVCKSELTREGDPSCSYCSSEGFLWDEGWQWTYSNYLGADSGQGARVQWLPPGQVRVDYKVFYLRYDADIQYGDKIVEVKLDTEGVIVQPLVRTSIYRPQTIDNHRSDNSRSEYYTIFCREDQAVRLDNL